MMMTPANILCLMTIGCLLVSRAETVTPFSSTDGLSNAAIPCSEDLSCEEGCVVDSGLSGCPVCACPPTCEGVACSPGEECFLQEVACFRWPCFPQPNCAPIQEPCPLIRCAKECKSIIGSNGCPECQCQQTCKDIECKESEECLMKDDVDCDSDPCFAIPTCVQKTVTKEPCPLIRCAKECKSIIGSNDCPECQCQQTCNDIECRGNEECLMKDVDCDSDPCFAIPTCVQKTGLCIGTPNIGPCKWKKAKKRCGFVSPVGRWTYKASVNSCQRFRYYGATPSPNTFRSQRKCLAKCKRRSRRLKN